VGLRGTRPPLPRHDKGLYEETWYRLRQILGCRGQVPCRVWAEP
jgi:hypothetical protein